MYFPKEIVWVVLYKFDSPKKCKIISRIKDEIKITGYKVKYKHRIFEVSNVDVYPTQIDAEIYWSVLIHKEYIETLKYPDLYITDDFERANTIALKLISKYIDSVPHILFKYF